MISLFLRLALVIALSAAAGACMEEEEFIHCPFSNSIDESCSADDPTIDFTCVVGSHPFCSQELCVSWEGSEPFCTLPCAEDADCPGSSVCRTHLESQFCVPTSALSG